VIRALLTAAISISILAVACANSKDGASTSPADPVSDGEILFAWEHDGRTDVYAVSPRGGDPRPIGVDPGGGSMFPAAGPFPLGVVWREGGGEGLMLLSLDGAPPRPFGGGSSVVRNPSWAPDGSFVVVEMDRESFRDLYRIDVPSGAETRLTSNPEGNYEPAVSPDGKRVAFTSSRDGDSEIYVLSLDDPAGTQTRLTAFHRQDLSPSWSPDGRTIAFVSDREGTDRIFLVAADGTNLRRLTRGGEPETHEGQAVWSPDGTRIAYVARSKVSSIAVTDVATGATIALGETAGSAPDGPRHAWPSWSPDGRWLAHTTTTSPEEADLWIVSADGKTRRRITSSPGAEWLPRWLSASAPTPPPRAPRPARAGE
jgi:tol-pal system beta propeller repeat protein TolB